MHRANSMRHSNEPSMQANAPPPTSLLSQFGDSKLQKPSSTQSGENHHQQRQKHNTKQAASSGKSASRGADIKGATAAASYRRQVSSEHMKSCLSDGDFNEILIKVSDQEDDDYNHNDSPLPPKARSPSKDPSLDDGGERFRRRSSCSDAEESVKRSP